MTENKTEALKKQLEEEKAEREAQRLKEEKLKAEQEAAAPKKKPIPSWISIVCAVVVFALGFALFKHSALSMILIIAVAVVVWYLLNRWISKKNADINIPGEKEFSSEIATKLHELQDLLIDRAKGVKKAEVRETLGSIAGTLNKIADEVENDPKDRNKVRKLANYYGDMLLGLVDKYIKLQDNAAQVVEGENVETSMNKIEEAIKGAETSVRKLLDSLFSEDAMEINAEISTLDKLMKLEIGKEEGEEQ